MSPMFQVTELPLQTLAGHLNESLCRLGFQAAADMKWLALAACTGVHAHVRLPRQLLLPARSARFVLRSSCRTCPGLLLNVSGAGCEWLLTGRSVAAWVCVTGKVYVGHRLRLTPTYAPQTAPLPWKVLVGLGEPQAMPNNPASIERHVRMKGTRRLG
jgi:hypothetical protein